LNDRACPIFGSCVTAAQDDGDGPHQHGDQPHGGWSRWTAVPRPGPGCGIVAGRAALATTARSGQAGRAGASVGGVRTVPRTGGMAVALPAHFIGGWWDVPDAAHAGTGCGLASPWWRTGVSRLECRCNQCVQAVRRGKESRHARWVDGAAAARKAVMGRCTVCAGRAQSAGDQAHPQRDGRRSRRGLAVTVGTTRGACAC